VFEQPFVYASRPSAACGHRPKAKANCGKHGRRSAQGAKFVVQTATMMVLARLLSPEDFGLQGMVTGFLGLFKREG
jgi:hypothetical protein